LETTKRIETHFRKSIANVRFLRIVLEASAVSLWLVNLLGVILSQNYNGNLTFDLFMARVGDNTANHATTYLFFLSVFPIAYLILRNAPFTQGEILAAWPDLPKRQVIIPAFLLQAYAFALHEGGWQIPYWFAWHSLIDSRLFLWGCAQDVMYSSVIVASLVLIYKIPKGFFVLTSLLWAAFLVDWYGLGFHISVLSKLPGSLIIASQYNLDLPTNQIEFFGWLFFVMSMLICLQYFIRKHLNNTKD
jgi:hypothetical protein